MDGPIGDSYQRNSLMHSVVKIQIFNARMKLKSAMFAVSAVTSFSVISQRSLAGKRGSLTKIITLEEDGEEDQSGTGDQGDST